MTPLILRPQPAANELAACLRAVGHSPVVSPLLEYRPGQDLARLSETLLRADVVIATSKAAVTYASAALNEHDKSWPTHPSYLAVGQTTAKTWRADNISADYPADARSEGLLALPELTNVTGKKIVILRGNGGRELLSETLTQRGAEVICLECYQRHYPVMQGETLWTEWQAAGTDSVIITSSEIFRQLVSLLPKQAFSWLQTLLWYVPTQRIADEISEYGIQTIFMMTGAHHQAVVAALKNTEDKTDE